ncbi:Outer membrane receptor proteins, mostly Fe transport [Flavobacterium fryxellicola]|uniref:TonB-dependent receptor n=1 Tax=Flavobacterium fryxellicola TaxID=249352 RepID=A0A167WHA5_9FLAO|nr:TonB-dependent receptor [Flavobacterium fryxellicola]OAB27388.1 TonB-dependent receptor [Flavobacterium fryxellicola]SHN79017.1 Outer membrane receptor proteins, mostly Fe transport [Flavobacterium fryxellicola]
MRKLGLIAMMTLASVFAVSAQTTPEKAPEKTTELNEVTVIKTKKAIEQKADRTIFNFSDQPSLNTGSVLEGIKKLPGVIASDIAGMMYQGKQLDVFLDGRPLNISTTELNAFLEGMPANAIEKIEIITQPGAEFPATSGGAILNIITNKNAKNYLSATYTNSTSFTSYDQVRWRMNNSLLLSAKNKYFGWQLNLGQNYRESAVWTALEKQENGMNSLLSKTDADRVGRNNFIKSALTFDIGKDRLLLNYDLTQNNNDSYTLGNGPSFSTNDASMSSGLRQDAVVTYQKKFKNTAKKLEFKLNYNNNTNDFELSPVGNSAVTLANSSNQNLYNAKVDYSQPIKFSDEGKVSLGALYEELLFDAASRGVLNLEYKRRTAASYLEVQTKFDKMNFIMGGRAEEYNITGKTDVAVLSTFKQFRFFPNASAQYNFSNSVNFNVNYNKKITLPSTSALNPNNTNYQNPNVDYSGNPNLQPTIFDNYDVKLSAFDYAFISYNISSAKNQVINRVTLDADLVVNTNENIPEVKIHNFSVGMPIPYMLFTKGLTETLKMNVNPDTMNFLYVYAGYQYHQIPNVDTNGFWMFNLMSQIVLPEKIKFVANYNYIIPKGNYFYFIAVEPIRNALDLTFSRKFLKEQLTLSIFADDVLNTNRNAFNSFETPLLISSKQDTRKFGFSLNYKIPTKNKLAKENPNLLNKEKKEEDGILNQ